MKQPHSHLCVSQGFTMVLLLAILISACLNSVSGEDISCTTDELKGLCRARYECLDSGYDSESCDIRGRQICCPLGSVIQIDRKMTIIKPMTIKVRRPMIKMRKPLRSMIRRRKRRPSVHKHLSMMGNRLIKPTKHISKPYNSPYGNKLPSSLQPNGKYKEKPLSYYYSKQTTGNNPQKQILASSNAKPTNDLTPDDFIFKSQMDEYLSSTSQQDTPDMIGLYGDAPIELGDGKPSPSDIPMFPEEPDIFKNSDLFDAMFRPRKQPHSSRRIAELKCDEYKKISTETIAELSKFGMVPKKIERCSLAGMETAGTSGIARKAEFPHVAGLGYEDDGETVWGCGGSLISEQYVLTAAHCIYSPFGRPVKVDVGQTRLGDIAGHEFRISEISVHPLYNASGRYNDIALVKLAKRVRFSDSSRPTCLQIGQYYDVSAIGTHWEPVETMSLEVRLKSNLKTHRFSDGSETVGLRKAPYTILDNAECGIPQDTSDSLLCLRTTTPGPTCSTEGGGGPLQVKQGANRCMYSIIGIASMKSCEEPTMAVYTRIAHFLPWIESIVWS